MPKMQEVFQLSLLLRWQGN